VNLRENEKTFPGLSWDSIAGYWVEFAMGGAESGTEKSGLEHFLKIVCDYTANFFLGKFLKKNVQKFF